jgi:hypothetical protein
LRRHLPLFPLLFGCLLPDLLDKPLYYLVPRGGLITGSRTFGHTALFLLAWMVLAVVTRAPAIKAIAAGVLTHLLLDIGGELFTGSTPDQSIWLAIFWPGFGGRFPVAHFKTALEHLRLTLESAYVLAGELVGAALLVLQWRRRRTRQSV